VSTAVTAAVRGILARARTEGDRLYLPDRLTPGLYAQVERVLRAAGGQWKGGLIGAHVFPGDACAALAEILAATRVTSARQRDQWYPTPAEVIDELLAAAGLCPGLEVLEPSAGEGAIAAAVAEAGCAVDCVELDSRRAQAIEHAGVAREVWCADFLAVPTRPAYHAVVMNPPFARNADTRHVEHALRFLRPGGVLAAVMAGGIEFRTDRAARKIRSLADGLVPLPEGAFRESGADIDTTLVVIRAPGGRVPDGPVRVTLDLTAIRMRRFHPPTARRGTYIESGFGGRDRVFRWAGDCLGCGQRTWAHDDGDDDPRGSFGWWTACPMTAADYFAAGQVPDDANWPRCGACWNSGEKTGEIKRTILARDGHEADGPPGDAEQVLTLF
jgi:predicted RNA methylase